MLNKEICKRCVSDVDPDTPWKRSDDVRWRKGRVYCCSQEEKQDWECFGFFEEKHDECDGCFTRGQCKEQKEHPRGRLISIKNDPPEDCRYLVEQFLHHDATKEEARC